MQKNQYYFNLIEIVLTVAVIAFGVTVILGMIPRGLKAVRDASMESYSSEIIDQMASYLQQKGSAAIHPDKKLADEKKFLKDFKPATDEDIMSKYTLLVGQGKSTQEFDVSGFTRTNATGVFRYNDGADEVDKSIYVVVMGDAVTVDGDTRIQMDFSGMIRTWKRPREFYIARINHQDGVGVKKEKLPDGHDCVVKECHKHFDKQKLDGITGAVICMELSYPLSLPYAARTKKYYVFETDK